MTQAVDKSMHIEAFEACPASAHDQPLPALSATIPAGKRFVVTGLQHSFIAPYLTMLAGLDAPASGSIRLLGRNTASVTPIEQPALRRSAGFVLRGGPLLSVLNGIENLKLAARYHQIGDEAFLDECAQQLLSNMPVEINEQHLPAYMTRLERRLLAIARPLMLKPDILFIDSPFEGMDFQDKEHVARYLNNIAMDHSMTLLVGTDDLAFSRSFAEQVIFCDEEATQLFTSWQSFNQCSDKSITLLFEHQRMNDNARD